MNNLDPSREEDVLAEELREAFGLGPDASGFEVDLSAPRGRGSSAGFGGFGSALRLRRGTLLGDFEIQEELGRGGMGVVYRARQISLGRVVALKVLPDYTRRGPLAIQRFRTEARAAARLQHTHIVPIYAQGEEQGTYYYAMELVAGNSLDAAIRSRTRLLCPSNPSLARTAPSAPSLGDATSAEGAAVAEAAPDAPALRRARPDYVHLARLIADVADALDHAHKAGVIHRDIKPQNLLVGADERLHITDFGLARLADDPGITLSGEIMGTPAYLSPEQARADQVIDGRSDIYSLGVTLYELLTLRRPFVGASREQVLAGIKEYEPPAPRSLDTTIPKDLQTICLKAMEKDPAARYASAGAMAEDLRRFAEGRPILSRPAGPVTRLIKWSRRHKAASAALVAFALVVLLAGGLAASVHTARQRQAAALIDGVYDRLVYYDYRATPEQLADLDEAERLGGDARRITLLRGLAQLFTRADAAQRLAARAQLAGLVAEDPADADAVYLYAVALDRTGDAADAARQIAAADAQPGATPAGWFFRGLALQFRDAAAAIRSYDEAARLRAQEGDLFLQATLNQARARSQQMYATRTIDELGTIVRPLEQIAAFGLHGAVPHNYLAIAHRLAAEVYTGSAGARDSAALAGEHYAASLKWARLGEQVDPGSALCFIAEGMTLESEGDLAAATFAFDAAESVAAEEPTRLCEVLHYRWRLHYWQNNYPAALADIARYAGCGEQEAPYYAHFYPLLIRAEQGDFDAARRHAYALSADAGTNALAVVWTATALRLLGEEAAAAAWLADHADGLKPGPGEIPEQDAAWLAALVGMCRGQLSLAELLGMAQAAPQPWRLRGEAEFHAAAMALAAGDRPAALAGFTRAWRSYDAAIRYTYHGELIARKMLLDPRWPRWIPLERP